jgi:hypothetical protein
LNALWLLLVFAVGELTLENYLQATRATLILRPYFSRAAWTRPAKKTRKITSINLKHQDLLAQIVLSAREVCFGFLGILKSSGSTALHSSLRSLLPPAFRDSRW